MRADCSEYGRAGYPWGGRHFQQVTVGEYIRRRPKKKKKFFIMELLGTGQRKYSVDVLEAGEFKQLFKVTPEWFVCDTTVQLGHVEFSCNGKATVSLFVCPVGFSPLSWHTMLMRTAWDTYVGWLLDRIHVDKAGTHASIPCSTEDAYKLGPDDRMYLYNSGPSDLSEVTIRFDLLTYQQIISDPTKTSAHVLRKSVDVVTYSYSTKKAMERAEVQGTKLMSYLAQTGVGNLNRVDTFCSDSFYDYDAFE